jgi:hypothetical protein
LAAEDQRRLRSCEGKIFKVLQRDRYGMIWFGYGGSSTADFSLRPDEVVVVDA